jgi:hypothetical protein
MPSSGGNLYSSVCRVLGALNRGAVHKQPHVTVPASRTAWELGRALTAAGVLAGVAPAAPSSRRRGGSGRRRPLAAPSADDTAADPNAPSTTTTATTALRYALRYDRGAPLFSPPGAAGHLSSPLSLGAPVLEACRALSRPTKIRRCTLPELRALRRTLPPGLLLLSTDAGGLLTDAEAEMMGVGGVVLGHVQVPLAQALQARALLQDKRRREEEEEEEEQRAAAAGAKGASSPRRRVPLSEWASREHVARTVLPRLLSGVGGGGEEGAGSAPSAAEQALALLDEAEAREKRAAAAVAAARALAAQLETEEAALRGQVVATQPPPQPQRAGGGGGGGGDREAGGRQRRRQ